MLYGSTLIALDPVINLNKKSKEGKSKNSITKVSVLHRKYLTLLLMLSMNLKHRQGTVYSYALIIALYNTWHSSSAESINTMTQTLLAFNIVELKTSLLSGWLNR